MKLTHKLFFIIFALCFMLYAFPSHADWGIVDALNVSPFVPLVLDSMMSVAMGGYEFFVGNGDGIIYILVWAAVAFFIALYLVKMWAPKSWLEFFGISGGGEMAGDKPIKGFEIAENLLKPALRAVIAAAILLPLKPQYMTNFIIDPFLRFGALYTEGITENIFQNSPWGGSAPKFDCPETIVTNGYISAESCKFLVQPIADITHANNQIIKRGLQFLDAGLRGLLTLIPHGGEDFLNILTGLLLIITFVSTNFFMALLIIQGVFNFGFQLILYPFNVLKFVMKPKDPKKWVDLWDVFEPIGNSLKDLIITMIVCAFMLAVNIAAIKALFRWNNSVFVTAAGGSAHSNVPVAVSGGSGFGEHAVVWLSAILTFFLMQQIFDATRKKINEHAKGMDKLHKQATGDFKALRDNATKTGKAAWAVGKKIFGK